MLPRNQLKKSIEEAYYVLDENGLLVFPDNDKGIPKYVGTTREAKNYLTKICDKREVDRKGLGFAIGSSIEQFADSAEIRLDIEISREVTKRDPEKTIETMAMYAQEHYREKAPSFISVNKPAVSSVRGWSDKDFVAVDLIVDNNYLQKINSDGLTMATERIVDTSKKMFQSLDYALAGYRR